MEQNEIIDEVFNELEVDMNKLINKQRVRFFVIGLIIGILVTLLF